MNKKDNGNKLASISLLPSSILAKFSKKINEISKFFKKNTDKKDLKKPFAQATSLFTSSSLANITRNTLKIKEIFPNLQSQKIENIQKII